MDAIQPIAGVNRPLVATVHASPTNPAAEKGPADYVRAIRRRIWLVLAIAVPIATAGTLVVLRMPAVYAVKARILIEPPRVDPNLARIISDKSLIQVDQGSNERYVPDAINLLRGKSLASKVIADPSLGLPASALEGDPATELSEKINARTAPQSGYVWVTLEGTDPALATRTLSILLRKFRDELGTKSTDATTRAKDQASTQLRVYSADLKNLDERISILIAKSSNLAPGGLNLHQQSYEALRQRLYYQQSQAETLRRELDMRALNPGSNPGLSGTASQRLAMLEQDRKMKTRQLKNAQRISKDPLDPAAMRAKNDLRDIAAEMAEIQQASMAARSPTAVGSPEAILADAADQINLTQAAIDSTLLEMKKGMPEHSEYERLMTERKLKAQQVLDLSKTLAEFEMLIKSQKDPVTIEDEPTEPTMPIKPRRSVFIGGCVVLALAMGLGLVCFLEHIDHSVKVPEHLTAGLTLPLFGVVPRIRRGARNHRGGHLWTPGIPDSIEADAYRNLRASLLGVTQHRGPIVTLLVTSAKAGEGKSTTALNLAATCARAGERTLLMDVDLRRPSLGDVFPGDGKGTGLVDILRGELPWQRTVVQTDLPNLDFLPTGDTRDVPIEVLGSLELRQLLISLSQNHYDRVILDGPAVLGLADCRMLGRIVDAAVMVVRSGSQELRPLQRAKAMLEQSQVYIAGLIFNGLREDMENWSSYGPNPAEFALFEASGSRAGGVARGLEAPSRPGPALMAAGSVDA